MSTPLLKLYKGSYTSEQLSAKCTEGAIVFDNTTHRIYAGTENNTPLMFGSNVQDATFADSKLKIWKVGDAAGSPSITLDFSDIASASSILAVFQEMANKMGLGAQGTIDYSGTNYLSDLGTTGHADKNLVNADKALDAAIQSVSNKVDDLDVSEYEQATIDTTTTPGETAFKIKGIKETDGKIGAGTNTVDLKIDGTYQSVTNKIATQSTVQGVVNDLDVTGYQQVVIDTTTTSGETAFKVKGIKETDGKISNDANNDVSLVLDGTYDASTNKVATESTVQGAVTKAAATGATYDITAQEISNTWIQTVQGNIIAQGDTFESDIDKLDKKVAGLADELIRDEKVINTSVNAIATSVGLQGNLTLDLSGDASGVISGDTSVKSALLDLATAIQGISTDAVLDVKVNGTSVVDAQGVVDFGVQGNYNASTNKLATESTVQGAIEALDVNEYSQAEMDTTTTTGVSTFKIKGIKETDGKIAAGTNTVDINIDGTYQGTTNKIATQSTVTNAINNLDATADADTASGTGYATVTTTTPTGDFKVLNSVTETDGKLTAADAYQLKKVAATGKAEDVAIDDAGGKITATTVEGALNEFALAIEALQGSFDVKKSTNAADTPAGVEWTDTSTTPATTVTGTLVASADTFHKVYLVPKTINNGVAETSNTYTEYITTKDSSGSTTTYSWEKLGDIAVDLTGYVKTVTVNGKSYAVDSNSTNISLGDVITSITGETAISGGDSNVVAVTATTTKNTTNGTNVTAIASSVKIEEVADGLVKDGTASYTSGHYVIENNKLVSAEGKSSGDTYTLSANDGLVKASDVKAYVDSSINDASFRWSEWS